MKKIYYILLLIAFGFLIQPANTFVTIDQNQAFYAPYRYESDDSYQFLKMPYFEAEHLPRFKEILFDAAEDAGVNLVFRSFDPKIVNRSGDAESIVMFYYISEESRLLRLPFQETPTKDYFHRSSSFYTSSEDYPDSAGTLHSASKKISLYVSSLRNFTGSFLDGEFYLIDTSSSKTAQFLENLRAKSSYEIQVLNNQKQRFSVLKDSPRQHYLDVLKLAFGPSQLLVLASSIIAMLLVYIGERKRFSILRLFGYKYRHLFQILFIEFILPTLLVAVIIFLPLEWMMGMKIQSVFKEVLFAFLPILSVFLLIQLAVLLLFLFDQAFFSSLPVLQKNKNNYFLIGFAIVFKLFVLILMIPLLLYHSSRLNELLAFYSFQRQAARDYKNVWFLDLDLPNINLYEYTSLGEIRSWEDDPPQISWLKAFYDTISDKYPVIIARSEAGIEGDITPFEIQVNGNFVRYMQIHDANGNLLNPDNEEKMVITSEEFYNKVSNLLKRPASKEYFLSSVSEKFQPDGFLSGASKPDITPILAAEGTQILSHVYNYHAASQKGWINRFVLVVNNLPVPGNLGDYAFVDITEEQKNQLLREMSHFPFASHLQWIPFEEENRRILEQHQEELRRAVIEIAGMLLAIIVFSYFLYTILFEWFAHPITVKYLFGQPFYKSAMPILLIILLIDSILFNIVIRQENLKIFAPYRSRVHIFLFAIDIFLFLVSLTVYSRAILKNLTARE